MPIQAPQWTEFLSCPVCYNVFSEKLHRPISLACGHTVCKSCLSKLQQSKCPFDQSLITRDVSDLPVNFALLQLVCATAVPEDKERGVPKDCRKYYEDSKSYIEVLALLLKPVSSATTGSIIPPTSSSSGAINTPTNCVLSRPMQRKLITLVNCQLVEEEGRSRAVRAARSLGERTVTELILQHQNPQQLSSNLWAAVRGRGCQFLGPAMQEEVLRLILLALEDGSALSRKVLVLFVVQRLECQYPQASKTAIGHVVQLLYRASCFKVTKRDQESSLMQLKEEYRSYETLRREHDTQIVQIAMEAGLRIAPDQWSSLLYGDSTHKSHMQSIIDKLQTPQTFCQSVSELLIALQRTGDPHSLQRLTPQLEFLSSIDPSPDVPCPSWENLEGVLKAAKTVVEGLVTFLQNSGHKKHDFLTPFNNVRYKTSMCRDFAEKGNCPRGSSCTFAHSEEELERHRQRNKKIGKGVLGLSTVQPPAHGVPDNRLNRVTASAVPDNRLNRATVSGVPANVPTRPRTPANRAIGPTKIAGKQEQDNLSHRSSDSEDMINSMQHANIQANTPQGAAGYSPMVAMVMPNSHQNQSIPPTQQPPPNAPVPVMPQMNMPPVYRGQTPQPGEIPPPPVMPPQPQPHPHYDLMAFPGALMGQGKYPIPPPMNPMMYMYPGMSPYMPYYHPGYMPQGGMRYHFDGYRTPLNPYAEPWNPHSQQQMNHDYAAMGGPSTLDAVPNVPCSVCSHRNQQDSVVVASQGDPYISQTVAMSTVTCTASATDTYQASLTDNVNSSVASVVSTSDALINRQSLSNLQERRNSLLAIMKERQRNPNSTEEARLKQSTGMASYKDLIERMTQQSCPTSDHDNRERTLEHPVPRDAGPPGLRSTFVNQKGLFERLGALSGMPPSSVNDSIMASWMTATLSASETSNNNKKASTVYSSACETPPPVSSVTYSNTSNSIGWNSSANQSAASSSVGKAYGLEETSWNGLEEDYPYWQDVVQTTESPPPSTGALRSLLNQPEFSSFNNSIAQSIMSSLSYSTFLSDMDQEEVIPFDPPIISKFGPISRTKYTKNNDTVPLKVTADEMIKTIPVTAVTPLSRPPLPNAATVPSRFTPTSVDPVSVSAKTMYEPEPYSLWKQEVIQLEQKAQEANTEDERLSVELQAVEMQISMKQQQLQDAHDVQQEQRQASEYIRHRNNTRPDRAQWTDQ